MANANSNIHLRPKLHAFFCVRTYQQLPRRYLNSEISVPANTETEARNLHVGLSRAFGSGKLMESHHVI